MRESFRIRSHAEFDDAGSNYPNIHIIRSRVGEDHEGRRRFLAKSFSLLVKFF